MDTSARLRKGIYVAIDKTGISSRQASLKAGFNENQLNRFLQGRNDILVASIDKICLDGFGLPFESVFKMGGDRFKGKVERTQ